MIKRRVFSRIPPSLILFKIENLVLRARSEVIGSAIDQICSRFQVFRRRRTVGQKTAGQIEKETDVSYDLHGIRLRAPAVVTFGCDYGSAGRAYACDLI